MCKYTTFSIRALLYLLLILYSLGTTIAANKPRPYYFKQIGIDERLSQSRVQAILNDHKGYLWIGTQAGLNRYDRDRLTQYYSGKDQFLPSNNILFITEDTLLNLWVGTAKGLCLYDRSTNHFKPIRVNGQPLLASAYLLTQQGLLFLDDQGIYLYHYHTGDMNVVLPLTYHQRDHYHSKMIRYDKHRIIINTGHKVFFFDEDKKTIAPVPFLNEKMYTAIYMDTKGQLWTSSYGKGISCYKDGVLRHTFNTQNSKLTYDVIYDMVERNEQLWIATDGGGINIISLKDYSISAIQQIQNDLRSLPTNSFFRIYKDPKQNIWLGSIRGGLIGVREVYARSYRNVPFDNPYGLSNQTVNSFFQDRDGTIWIGTDGGGINRFDPTNGTFVHYPATRYEKIVSIVDYSPHELLYFSYNKGIFIFNKKTGKQRPFILVDQQTNTLNCISGYSVNILRIAKDKILFSGLNLYIYDMTTKTFTTAQTQDTYFINNTPLFLSTKKNLTYLSTQAGIGVYDSQTEKFSKLFESPYLTNDACIDSKGVFWLATAEGILYYNPTTKRYKHIQTELFREATSIIADPKGRIWIGTRHNLYIYSTQTQKFAILGETDGVLPNEYIFHAAMIDRSGNILMGGVAGMSFIRSDIHFYNDRKHPIELLDVLLNGQSTPLQKASKDHIATIEIPYNFNSLQLKVLHNEADVFRKNHFRFKIEGIDQRFVNASSNSFNINYLPVGTYTITSSFYEQDMGWSAEQQLLRVVVTPPWWKCPYVYVALILLLIAIGYIIIRHYSNKRKAAQALEIETIRNKTNEEKLAFLTNISHELRTPLTLVCTPLKRIIDQQDAPHAAVEIQQLTAIYKQAMQMNEIIDMALDVRKLEEGKEILHIQQYAFNPWVMDVVHKFEEEFRQKGITLQVIPDQSIGDVPFDKNKCTFVLSNFLMNALKFSQGGTRTTIRTQRTADDTAVSVAVCDQGIGLHGVDMQALFTNFYQGFHDKGGSGIGLAYSKRLITLHKGWINATPNAERGSTFSFGIPLVQPAGAASASYCLPLSAQEQEQAAPPPTVAIDGVLSDVFAHRSILLVEDTPDLLAYMQNTMQQYFAHVYTARDGKKGLEQALQKLPDIIVTDMMMPQMNGLELCHAIKQDLQVSHTPLILLTAYSRKEIMNESYKTGADAFVSKPFDIETLLTIMANCIGLREQIKNRYQNFTDVLPTLQEASFSNADETFLLRLNTLIRENLSNPDLDVSFLASNLCISRSLLYSKVKSITGMSTIDYINSIRIETAIELMRHATLTLTEIAEQTGFSSLRYFSKMFKNAKGVIPSVYKKSLDSPTPP